MHADNCNNRTSTTTAKPNTYPLSKDFHHSISCPTQPLPTTR